MPRNLNPNRAKIHRNYTVGEVASLLNIHKNTVRAWIKDVGIDEMGSYLINPSKDKGTVTFEPPRMSLDILLQYGKMLEQEQENVKRVQLADAYLDGAVLAGEGGSSNTQQSMLLS